MLMNDDNITVIMFDAQIAQIVELYRHKFIKIGFHIIGIIKAIISEHFDRSKAIQIVFRVFMRQNRIELCFFHPMNSAHVIILQFLINVVLICDGKVYSFLTKNETPPP